MDPSRRGRKKFGQLLKTFEFEGLRRLAIWRPDDIRFHHHQDKEGYEAGIRLGRGARSCTGVGEGASSMGTAADSRCLRRMEAAAGASFTSGVGLYEGGMIASFGDGT